MKLLIILLTIFFITTSAIALIIRVPDDFENIQAAIDETEDEDTVLVAPGEYVENITFGERSIVVGSLILTTGNPAYTDSTIIDGGSNGRSVVSFAYDRDEEFPRSFLTGFTLRNGRTDYGGGVYISRTNPVLDNLIIRDNEADRNGGGVYITVQNARERNDPELRNIVISTNTAGINGGGICCLRNNSCMSLHNVVIRENRADHGGGIYFTGSTAELTDITIHQNYTPGHGGGIFCSEGGDLTINGGIISDNFANQQGGGIAVRDNPTTITRLVISGNRVNHDGGGAYFSSCDVNLSYLTVSGNEARDFCGGIVFNAGGEAIVDNSIFWNNTGVSIGFNPGGIDNELTLSYSDIENDQDGIELNDSGYLEWGMGNIADDPLFADAEEGDFSLTADSPCIDAGDPADSLDPDSTRADMGAMYFHAQDIQVHPPELEFPDYNDGEPQVLSVFISNIGHIPLEITAQEIIPFEDEDAFEIVSGGGAFVLPPDSTHETAIAFDPPDFGDWHGWLRIESNDPNEEVVNIWLSGTALSVDENILPIPMKFDITGIYPNPFNTTTTVTFTIPKPDRIKLSLFDLTGRESAVRLNGKMHTGRHEIVISSQELSSGIYLLNMRGKKERRIQKVVLIR